MANAIKIYESWQIDYLSIDKELKSFLDETNFRWNKEYKFSQQRYWEKFNESPSNIAIKFTFELYSLNWSPIGRTEWRDMDIKTHSIEDFKKKIGYK